MTRRRALLFAFAGASAAFSWAAFAQSPVKIHRVGVLRPTAAPVVKSDNPTDQALIDQLARLGYVEGRNLRIDTWYADGDPARLPALARELVASRPDVIIAVSAAPIRAAMAATRTIPIVMYGNFDPVASGFVASLARPGGNVTGVLIAPYGTLGAKKLEILKEVVPKARRIAVLAPEDPNSAREQLPELQRAARVLGVELAVVALRGDDYADAFARIAAAHPDALFVISSTYFVRDRHVIMKLANRYRLPAIWEWREQAVDGGLLAYGSSLVERGQRIADFVDRIIKGADPAGIAVDQPTKFGLVVNLKAARAIGLTVPQSVLLRADEVIQ
ncbi:MAG: ABC transporter substrate-binding protein [Burkholderiales bacterium]